MISTQFIDRFLNRRIRVTGDDDPRLSNCQDDRYQWMRLDNLKVSPRVLDEILRQRHIPSGFELRYDKRLAVIIPFRNRESHLQRLVPALKKHLQKEDIDHAIFVVEQSDDKLFNRAKLVNCGVKIAGNNFDYYCIHDVDMLPVNCSYGYPSSPLRLVSHANSNQGRRDFPSVFFSGIISITKDDFYSVNGFSNNFWHWGKEDDNFLLRLLLKGINPVIDEQGCIEEIDDSTDRYNIREENEIKTDKKKAKFYIKRNHKNQQKVARGLINPHGEGLSNVEYALICLEQHENYTLAKVRL